MPPGLKKFIQRWLITTLAVLVAVYVVPGIRLEENNLWTPFVTALVLGILFPQHFVRFGVIDDRRGGTDIRHEITARVDLVAWQDRVGHLARHRDCARTSQRQLPRLRARRRVNGPLARRLAGRRRFCGFGARFCRRVSRHDAETDHCRERKRTDPETCFSVHVECPGPVV